jgi:hypothetical protein
MVQEQQLQDLGVGGRPGQSTSRGEVVELLQQVLPSGAPQPTEEEIEFLLEQFRKLEPGTALSFNPALLGQSGDGTSDPLGRLQLDVAFGPPPLLPSSSDGPENCIDINDDALLLAPAHRLQAAALSIPVEESRIDAPRDNQCDYDISSTSGAASADARKKSADSGREESVQRHGESEPAALPTASETSSPQLSHGTFNHSSIRDALRRVKDQVKAVERLRSSIELEEGNRKSRRKRRPQQ